MKVLLEANMNMRITAKSKKGNIVLTPCWSGLQQKYGFIYILTIYLLTEHT